MHKPDATQVFLSYSNTDQRRAERVVKCLQAHKLSVWWNRQDIPFGANLDSYVLDVVAEAACVVVLWSHASIVSRWVIAEAETALRRNVLLPVRLDNVQVPQPFDRIRSLDLSDWGGDAAGPQFSQLVETVQSFLREAPAPAETTRLYKTSQRRVERRTEQLFKQNLHSRSSIEHAEIANAAFYGTLSWNLQPGINVLLGRNGYGKTYLLRALLALLQYSDRHALQILGEGNGALALLRDGSEAQIRFAEHYFDEETALGQLPVLAIPDTRFINRSVTTLGAVGDQSTGDGDRADLARFGAWHFLEEQPYEGMIQTFLYGLCLDWLEAGGSFEGEQFSLIRGVVRELTDQSFEFDRVSREGRNRFTLYVRTEGNENNPLPIQKSSQGTSSVIAMVGLIYEFLKSLKQQKAEAVRLRGGIVVIDEIDAHLHPVWQQKIVAILRDRFPNVQFILTAHNPIVVAGCLEDEVSVLRKADAGGFALVQFPNDFIGWTSEDIYRKVFEIEGVDASFAHYDALRPFKGELSDAAAALAQRPKRSEADERRLVELEEQLLYIEKVEQSRTRRLGQEELERENQMLRDRLQGSPAAHEAAAAQVQAADRLRTDAAALRAESDALQLRHEQQLARLRRRSTAAMAIAILFAALLAVVWFAQRA